MTKTIARTTGKVFYGWWIVLAGSTVSLYAGGTFFSGFTTFFDPIVNEFRWSRAATSLGFSLHRLEEGIAGPIVGFLVDKFGPRRLMLIGLIIAGAGFLLFSRINSLWSFYLAFFIISVGLSASTHMVTNATVANWFLRKRTLAWGLLSAGYGLGGLLLPIMVLLISAYGWRNALIIVGIGMWVLAPVALVLRHKPEPYGYLPDGEQGATGSTHNARGGLLDKGTAIRIKTPLPLKEANLTVREALKTRSFWLLALVYLITSGIQAAVLVHVVPAFSVAGFSRQTAGFVAMLMLVVTVPARLMFALVGWRFDTRRLLVTALISMVIASITFSHVQNLWMVAVIVVTYGLGHGGMALLRLTLQGENFGIVAFGAIYGLLMVGSTIGGIFGPVFMGWMFDIYGSYSIAFMIIALASALAIPLVLATKRA
ncbi:MAG: MFS transporter [Chloroflexi bacterium]|nr:MFS transporter [Chloroflexota bacterium]